MDIAKVNILRICEQGSSVLHSQRQSTNFLKHFILFYIDILYDTIDQHIYIVA